MQRLNLQYLRNRNKEILLTAYGQQKCEWLLRKRTKTEQQQKLEEMLEQV